jgi:hypothetical protein
MQGVERARWCWGSLNDRLRQRLEQPIRAGQRHATVASRAHQLTGGGQFFSRRRPRLLRFLR